ALLDTRLPGWRANIDVDKLNMSSTSNCVLGQLFGDYVRGTKILQVPAELQDSFCCYDDEWLEELQPVVLELTREQAALLRELLYYYCSTELVQALGLEDWCVSSDELSDTRRLVSSDIDVLQLIKD